MGKTHKAKFFPRRSDSCAALVPWAFSPGKIVTVSDVIFALKRRNGGCRLATRPGEESGV